MEVSVYGHSFIGEDSHSRQVFCFFKVEYALVKGLVIIKKVLKTHESFLKDNRVMCLTGELDFSCRGTPGHENRMLINQKLFDDN